ncbi:hypothetical protein DCAR_0727828 [Daucus carota subsp. sativus]|uniref:Uncharacterized protein n=1 Tax=Daucus carota subsp. sativus TaxID=79200 RepID=A0A164T2P8_DAUCS|nr:hypothetical protein DCAR_0727828 [Daucus carota subsp. sativus]
MEYMSSSFMAKKLVIAIALILLLASVSAVEEKAAAPPVAQMIDGISTDIDGAKEFCSSGKLNSPPRCHNVSNLDELNILQTKKKGKALHYAKSSHNSTPLLFDVFNYETSMMRDHGGGKSEMQTTHNNPPPKSVLVDKENTNIRQPLAKQSVAAHCQMKSIMKRKPLSPLNDRSRLNCDMKKPEVNNSPLMETQIPPQAKRKNSQPNPSDNIKHYL